MIEYVSFGRLVFKGKVYRSDCIIKGHEINSRWWRKKGDKILYEDLEDVIKSNPEIIVIGRGFMNFLDIPESTIDKLRNDGIDVEVKDTMEAVNIYNDLDEGNKKVVGVFHLV